MNPSASAISGTVRRTHDTGRILAVELDLGHDLRAILLIDYQNGRMAARRWNPGERVTAWGWTSSPDLDHDPALVFRAHTVQRDRPGHRGNLLDPERRKTPRQRNLDHRARRLAQDITVDLGHPPDTPTPDRTHG